MLSMCFLFPGDSPMLKVRIEATLPGTRKKFSSVGKNGVNVQREQRNW